MSQSKIVVYLSIVLVASATYPAALVAQSDDNVLARFDKHTGIPDEVMLPKFVQLLTTYRDEEEHDGHNHGARTIQRKLLLDSYEEAEALLDYFVEINEQIDASKSQYFRENVCPIDSPRPTGPTVLDNMNAADSNIDTLGQLFLVQIESDLSGPTYDYFLQWMDDQKNSMLIIRSDYRHVYRNRDPNLVRQEVCGKFDDAMSRKSVRRVQ